MMQVVTFEGQILEKPESEDEARQFLKGYGRSPAGTVGSLICTNLQSGLAIEELDFTRIFFKPIPDEVVDKLIEQGEWKNCAGGLRIEEPLLQPYLIGIEGGQDSVMGVSGLLVMRLLLQSAGML